MLTTQFPFILFLARITYAKSRDVSLVGFGRTERMSTLARLFEQRLLFCLWRAVSLNRELFPAGCCFVQLLRLLQYRLKYLLLCAGQTSPNPPSLTEAGYALRVHRI
jgi:hypothetical protein